MPFDQTPEPEEPQDDPILRALAACLGRWPNDVDVVNFGNMIRLELSELNAPRKDAQ
jgi:hypothetical protein